MEYKVKTRLTTMVLLALMAFGSVQASDAVSEKDNFYLSKSGRRKLLGPGFLNGL